MRTTVAIDDDLMAELMRVEPGLSRSAAMRRAIETHVRRKRLEAFTALAGSRLVDADWHGVERAELHELKRRGKRR
jgi:Arc/MetJ family transcription regulator